MSEMDEEEYEYTKELYTGEIRKKDLLNCNEKELRIRCSITEQQLKRALDIIHKLEKENAELKAKIENHRLSYEANRDIDEEFE